MDRIAVARRGRLQRHLQPVLEQADHLVVGVGRAGVGQLGRRGPEQVVTEAPLGQVQVVVDVSDLDQRPLSPVAVFQAAAHQVDIGVFDVKSSVMDLDRVDPLCVGDPSFEHLAVSQHEHGPGGRIWRGTAIAAGRGNRRHNQRRRQGSLRNPIQHGRGG